MRLPKHRDSLARTLARCHKIITRESGDGETAVDEPKRHDDFLELPHLDRVLTHRRLRSQVMSQVRESPEGLRRRASKVR